MNRKLPGLMLVISTLSGAIAAQQGVGNSYSFWNELPLGLAAALIYSFLGIIVLMIGFKIFDWITPFSLNREIEEKNNTAAGLIVAGIMIALGLIVAAAIL
ncbi:hypothetical protein CMK13_09465 [Candidatus Poribacteria bacterium]|nr:hypothetical protein [Candidatus Poribacteria bacterium]MBF72946.1 hypothetical protein [Candidatus Poribacteria bacterium]OUT61912.1 MAG: hypothetical protein CBB75_08935 [bacterium TMED15]